MSKQGAKHPRKAAEPHEHAGKHHRTAAEHDDVGGQEKAGRQAPLAHGHNIHASPHAEEASELPRQPALHH